MKVQTYIVLAALTAMSATTATRAADACPQGLTVVGSDAGKIREFDEGGKFLGEIAKAAATGKPILECDDSRGLIKVQLADRTVWISRREAKLPPGATPPVASCITSPSSTDHDRGIAGVNGVDPASNCVTK